MPLDTPVLGGRSVSLEPLQESHREALRRAAADRRIWEFTLSRGDGTDFDAMFDEAMTERDAGRRAPFAVRRVSDSALIGSTSYLDIMLRHRRIEIGSTWYRPDTWGTVVNPECKLLLLAHAFETLGVNRVALLTDSWNQRSQNAIAKLGATREGLLRSHMITQGGRGRDTVVFAIIAAEWPSIRQRLQARIDGPPA